MAQEVAHKDLHRIVFTALIYNKEGKYLIVKRSEDKKVHPGKWSVPGGGLETDDYVNRPSDGDSGWNDVAEIALKREVKEEVNLEIGESALVKNFAFIRPDGIPVFVMSYCAEYISGEVKLEDGMTDFAWVTSEEAKRYDMIESIPGEMEIADKLRA